MLLTTCLKAMRRLWALTSHESAERDGALATTAKGLMEPATIQDALKHAEEIRDWKPTPEITPSLRAFCSELAAEIRQEMDGDEGRVMRMEIGKRY